MPDKSKEETEQELAFFKSKLEQLIDEAEENDEKMSKLSEEKIRLERGILKIIKILGE